MWHIVGVCVAFILLWAPIQTKFSYLHFLLSLWYYYIQARHVKFPPEFPVTESALSDS